MKGALQTGGLAMVQSQRPGDEEHAVRLEDVHKRYGLRGTRALAGVDLAVRRGECFGLLGPNGAGKTTLMKILMTTVRPTSGRAWLVGRPIGDREALRQVGYLPESFQFPPYLTPRTLLDYGGRLSGVPRDERRRRTGELLDLVGMTAWTDRRIKTFSKGMTQRVALAQALINRPVLLFLDEPTDGLDPMGRAQFRDAIRRLSGQGVTIFLNSHLLNEVEQVCTRVAVLSEGRVLREGHPSSLVRSDGTAYRIRVAGPLAPALAAAASWQPRPEGDGFLVTLPEPEQVNAVIDALRSAGVRLLEVAPVRSTLEAQFLELLGAGQAGAAHPARPAAPGPAGQSAPASGEVRA